MTKTQQFQNVSKLILPTFNGQVCILPNHSEAFFLLKKGTLYLQIGNQSSQFEIEEGVCHVREEESILFTEIYQPT